MPETSPVETLFQIAGGHVLVRSLHAVADLGVADVVRDGPTTIPELAKATGTNADALRRVR